MTNISLTDETNQEWRQSFSQVSSFLEEVPKLVGDFYQKYNRPILYTVLIVVGIIIFKTVLAILDALNDIPFLSPFFELIGLGYSGWFIYRYLLKATTRQELSHYVQSLKDEALGKTSQDS
ncbi:MAG: CAAD domain-containing protein [Cyanobacteria bacterium LVE1205-1]